MIFGGTTGQKPVVPAIIYFSERLFHKIILSLAWLSFRVSKFQLCFINCDNEHPEPVQEGARGALRRGPQLWPPGGEEPLPPPGGTLYPAQVGPRTLVKVHPASRRVVWGGNQSQRWEHLYKKKTLIKCLLTQFGTDWRKWLGMEVIQSSWFRSCCMFFMAEVMK